VNAAKKNVGETASLTNGCELNRESEAVEQEAPGYREMVAARFARVVAAALDKLDRAFYELAVSETDRGIQDRYLEAKRAVHLKRVALQAVLQKDFFFSFDKVLQRGGLDSDPAEVTSKQIIHTLLKQGEYEIEQIAIQSQAQKPVPNEARRPDPYLVTVHNLERGTWIEFREVDGLLRRARLAWINPVTGAYIFIDQRGLKVAEKSPQGLAAEFKRATARILKDVGLLDVAASNILYGLRKKMASGTDGD
jgi:hypothetical protein